MGNSRKRENDISNMHPAVRENVLAIQAQLKKENIPFEVFEAFRTPERQADLYAQGRTKPGTKVTWVGPWHSIHQYGLAVDFVLKENGKWSWDTTGHKEAWWDRMHVLAKENGMTPIYNSKGKLIEKPHIQIQGVKSRDLYKGVYPVSGDEAWADRLNELIDNWSGHLPSPPRPSINLGAPAIDTDLMASMEAESPAPIHSSTNLAERDLRFQKLHEFIKDAEGGFVNNQHDKGGATNFGITRSTLAEWRETNVTEEDVAAMGQKEAEEILYTNYYIKCKCDKLHDRVAMVVYNMAVHSGSKVAQRTVQRAFNELGMKVDGTTLEEDGIIGRITLSAINQTDPSVLSEKYLELYEQRLRGLEDFVIFGAGWVNRVNKLRVFLNTLPEGEGKRPIKIMKVKERDLDIEADDILRIALMALTGGKSVAVKALAIGILKKRLERKVDDGDDKFNLLNAVLDEKINASSDEKATAQPAAALEELTPVNNALGPMIGKLLDGKKSIIGIVGLVATAVLPQLGLSSSQPQLQQLLADGDKTTMFTLFSLLTSWGFLGKIDKKFRDLK
ncbi:glycosyl hydrolase 108 family protein [Ruegeria meonggei]|uniref:glycosyl hydrolase 108 family protein n=1 Tax=Ruegeria meonggei TaxID=1446476 RepID=UPI00366CA0B9